MWEIGEKEEPADGGRLRGVEMVRHHDRVETVDDELTRVVGTGPTRERGTTGGTRSRATR